MTTHRKSFKYTIYLLFLRDVICFSSCSGKRGGIQHDEKAAVSRRSPLDMPIHDCHVQSQKHGAVVAEPIGATVTFFLVDLRKSNHSSRFRHVSSTGNHPVMPPLSPHKPHLP
mmetsp:Transcript_5204/g.5934  ORF Transcript_5204/g.5934 Transcript_5204/m.5934 type:complete len:113 (-) Transcript_5204:1953-2291(-)